jgi:hypothetical protein
MIGFTKLPRYRVSAQQRNADSARSFGHLLLLLASETCDRASRRFRELGELSAMADRDGARWGS